MKRESARRAGLLLLICIVPSVLWASQGHLSWVSRTHPLKESGHLAWVMVSAILVIFMTVPGLALFYGGMSARKNALSLVIQCFILSSIISLLWVVVGYSLTYGTKTPFIGNFGNILLSKFSLYAGKESAKHMISVLFSMSFAMITAAIITGGVVGRMKLLAVLLFVVLWEILVYYPVAHWIWGQGWLENMGMMDYAGGAVVHINSGIASLVAAIMVGRSREFSRNANKAHNLMLVVLGTALLWIGWFGFNGGSSHYFTHAPSVMLITQVAACAAFLTWAILGWVFDGKASVAGVCSGALVGLVVITPAAGYIGILGAMIMAVVGSVACFFLLRLKYFFKYDDTLNAFGIHGLGGIIGSLLTGVFFAKSLGGRGHLGFSMGHQFLVQLIGTVSVIIWSALVSLVILRVIKWVIGLRVRPETESMGLDTVHFSDGDI